MNEREQIISYLLGQVDLKNKAIAELQAKVAELESEASKKNTPIES